MAPSLQIIVGSTRPGRVGLSVAQWVERVAIDHGGFAVEIVDLAEIALPMLDEPNHPRLRQYTQPHTLEWSTKVDAADAFVMVTPEYNYGFPAPLKNAIDFLHHEWSFKPVGIVSYGGVSGGTRAAQMLKQVITTLRMYPLPEAVPIPFVRTLIDDDTGVFTPTDTLEPSATLMLDSLQRWTTAMETLRAPAHS